MAGLLLVLIYTTLRRQPDFAAAQNQLLSLALQPKP